MVSYLIRRQNTGIKMLHLMGKKKKDVYKKFIGAAFVP